MLIPVEFFNCSVEWNTDEQEYIVILEISNRPHIFKEDKNDK